MATNNDARALVRLPLLTPSPLQRYMPGTVRLERHEHLLLATMGGTGFEDNYVVVFGPVPPERLFALAERFFGSVEYSIVVESGTDDALDEVLMTQGWPIDEDEPSLLLTPIPEPPAFSSGLEIRPVSTAEEYADFMDVSQTGRRWIPSLEAATDPDVSLFVGYWGGEPVATSRLNCLGDIGEINGVATHPDYRRRGFGTEMTWAAIAEGARRGCSAIVLAASEMGYPVYVRMGFVPVCSYRTYVQPSQQSSMTSADATRARIDS